ncbi:MAG: NAD-dependent epimerase/dehydratase family protein [Aminivibrio sp.]|jgi:nucleoside-diphosphate-sugar epimerase
MRRVLVTGAAGFVGGHLIKHLQDKNYKTFSITRENLDDPYSTETWRKVLESADCETVVHLIAKTHASDAADPSAMPSYRRINVDITKAILEASKDFGIKKLIYLSSIKAVGEETPPDEPFTEKSPCHPEDCYGKTKKEAEQLIFEYSDSFNTVTLRPPLIYGPGVKGNFLKLLNAVKRRIPLPLASVKNARSLLYVGNLTSAIEHTIELPTNAGALFHIADNEAPSTPELLRLIAGALNKSSRLLPCPPRLLEIGASAIGKRETVKKLTRSLVVSNRRAQKFLSGAIQDSITMGLEKTSAWFCESNGQSSKNVPIN